MFGSIVLRDVPKEEARIDLMRLPIKGGFRGFKQVLPALHYVSVKTSQSHVGFWCWLKPNQALVKVFDPAVGFQDDQPDSTAQFSQLALSGAMDHALQAYDPRMFADWLRLTSHLKEEIFPPTVHAQDPTEGYRTRFEQAFMGTHQGEGSSFLAEFQYAFLRWLVSLDTASQDGVAFDRWRHLLLASYNAGEDRIRQAADLFPPLANAMTAQFKLLPDDWFAEDSFLTQQAGYMVEDMQDTEIEELVDAAGKFSDYLQSRK